MPMPYRIEFVAGNRRETTPDKPADWPKKKPWPRTFATDEIPFKTYPNGVQVAALPEEVEMWKHVQAVEADLGVRDATIRMACDRLGGEVEGHPPHPGNFLQRIDELVALETRVAQAEAADGDTVENQPDHPALPQGGSGTAPPKGKGTRK
jgi:hypothetical protein